MKFLKLMKDGGPLSRVWGYFLVEIKALFSVALLHFKDGSREAYHSHAFNSISWVLRGKLVEHEIDYIFPETGIVLEKVRQYLPSARPIITRRSMFHKVESEGDTWVITFRGPWVHQWQEFLPDKNRKITLTHGRMLVE